MRNPEAEVIELKRECVCVCVCVRACMLVDMGNRERVCLAFMVSCTNLSLRVRCYGALDEDL